MTDEPTSCANCGRAEEEAEKLNRCSACKLVKYCGRDCQIAHRPKHKKECKKRAAKLYDEELFKQPPKEEDCPICFLMLPTTGAGKTFMACCGKIICSGCEHAHNLQSNGGNSSCPFCRAEAPSAKEYSKMLEKRADSNDANATFQLGMKYLKGYHDSTIHLIDHEELKTEIDLVKALKFLQRAAELGSAPAYRSLAVMYQKGHGVSKDEAKSKQYYEKAALAGDTTARLNLGVFDAHAGNFDRAIKHWLIGASIGDIRAVNNVKKAMGIGNATKDDYAQALRQYKEYLDEVKSDQRDKAAVYDEQFKYLIEDDVTSQMYRV